MSWRTGGKLWDVLWRVALYPARTRLVCCSSLAPLGAVVGSSALPVSVPALESTASNTSRACCLASSDVFGSQVQV